MDWLSTVIAAIGALLGVWLGQHWQGTREHHHWLREKRLEAYMDALQVLYQEPLVHLWKRTPADVTPTLSELFDNGKTPIHIRMETLSDKSVRDAWNNTTDAAHTLIHAIERLPADATGLPEKETERFTHWRRTTLRAIRSSLT